MGPLPDPLRQAIEDEFKSGKLQILVSTNTLGQGVNLPIRTVIIHSLERSWIELDEHGKFKDRHTSPIKRRDFWNICGRAGRAGKETEGQIVFVNIGKSNIGLYDNYQDATKLEEVESPLFDILNALIDLRLSQEDLIGYLDSHVLALLAEEIIDTEDETAIETFLGKSLVGIQAKRKGVDLKPLTNAVGTVSYWIQNRVVDKDRIKTFASTGLRVSSCETIEQAVEAFINNPEYADIIQNRENDDLRCNEDLIQFAYQTCSSVTEMQLDKRIKDVPTDNKAVFTEWINGTSISDMRAKYWNDQNLNVEDFGRYVSDQFTYKLPWGINGFLQILAAKLNIEFSELPMGWQQLPSMIKFGVNDVISCWAGSIGINSRSFAREISKIYLERHGVLSFLEFVEWIMNLPNEFVIREMVGNIFEKRRFLQARSRLITNRDLSSSKVA